ncbi:hypothetical protein [Actinoplanes sp. G11-F43]|uniref:hypothetical protein n=1 Tax=Actinoplanes sp. G11-F43 TaxID=3424130 RepID=UPI003D325415
MTSPVRIALTVAAGLLLTGCGLMNPAPDISRTDAAERVARQAEEAFAQLPPGATLRTLLDHPESKCDEGDLVFAERQYQIDYPQGWPVARAVPTLAGYWTGAGWETLRDERADPKLPNFAAQDPDGFRISIEITNRDSGVVDAYLVSSSPCVA